MNVKVDLDSGALGSAGSSSYITAQETSNIPQTSSVNIVADKGKDINAFSGGSKVTNLQSGKTATVEMTYTKAELTSSNIDTTTEVNALKVVSYNESLKEWESLSTVATYKDSSGDAVTSPSSDLSNVSSVSFIAIGSHFSAYALSQASDGSAPPAPSSVTATAGGAGSGQITVSWSASSGATGYYIYRDTNESGSFALLVDAGNVTSYTDTGATTGTEFFYKVGAYKSGGSSESAASSVVNATVENTGGGGTGGGGGGGGGSIPTPQPVFIPGDADSSSLASAVVAVADTEEDDDEVTSPTPISTAISAVFTTTLRKGQTSDDILRLQQLLNSDPSTMVASSGVGSRGEETDYYGSLTEQAVQKFQAKYGLVTSGTPDTTGFGLVGPKTRSKLAAVFGGVQVPATPTAPAVPTSVTHTFQTGLSRGMTSAGILQLQRVLNSDPSTMVASSGVGSRGEETDYYGSLTEQAVQKFQEKYGIAGAGEPGYGYVGPMTRAQLNLITSSTAPTPPALAAPAAADTSAIEAQIADLMKQVNDLILEMGDL